MTGPDTDVLESRPKLIDRYLVYIKKDYIIQIYSQ